MDSDASYGSSGASAGLYHAGGGATGSCPFVANASSINISASAGCSMDEFDHDIDISLTASANVGFTSTLPISFTLDGSSSMNYSWDGESYSGPEDAGGYLGDATANTTGLGLNLGGVDVNAMYGEPLYGDDGDTYHIVGTSSATSFSLNPSAQLSFSPGPDHYFGTEAYCNIGSTLSLSASVGSASSISSKGKPIRAVAVGDDTEIAALNDDPSGLRVGAISIAPRGKFDIGTGTMLIAYRSKADKPTPLDRASIAGEIARAYNHGTWTGFGLTTSAARSSDSRYGIGYAAVSDLKLDRVGGTKVSPKWTIVKYTLNGDTNLDGVVDGRDLDIIRKSFGRPGIHTWSEGDFNYDGKVDSLDMGMLLDNFGSHVK